MALFGLSNSVNNPRNRLTLPRPIKTEFDRLSLKIIYDNFQAKIKLLNYRLKEPSLGEGLCFKDINGVVLGDGCDIKTKLSTWLLNSTKAETTATEKTAQSSTPNAV